MWYKDETGMHPIKFVYGNSIPDVNSIKSHEVTENLYAIRMLDNQTLSANLQDSADIDLWRRPYDEMTVFCMEKDLITKAAIESYLMGIGTDKSYLFKHAQYKSRLIKNAEKEPNKNKYLELLLAYGKKLRLQDRTAEIVRDQAKDDKWFIVFQAQYELHFTPLAAKFYEALIDKNLKQLYKNKKLLNTNIVSNQGKSINL